jgi:hypothetical protein
MGADTAGGIYTGADFALKLNRVQTVGTLPISCN